MAQSALGSNIRAVRRFNRFYTRKIGVLSEGVYHSPFSLTEVRVLYELAYRQEPYATELARELGLDPGYLSRILRGFGKRGFIKKSPSHTDARQSHLSLTAHGRKVFGVLDARSDEEVGSMLVQLPAVDQARLMGAMDTVEQLLRARNEPGRAPKAPYLLRSHQPGDMGWVVHRHGALYAQEYGYDERFEALVAEIVANFIQHLDAKREHCWIAEKDGEIVGSVFLVKKSKKVAKLRLLLVEPKARGMGIGARLVNECVRFARQSGYRKITLWTQRELAAARHLYQNAGFAVVHQHRHHDFGRDSVAKTWELKL